MAGPSIEEIEAAYDSLQGDMATNIYNSGNSGNLGMYGQEWLQGVTNPDLMNPSGTDKSQSGAERIIERKQNYQYGGYAGGANDAAAAARGAVSPASTGLYGYGASYAEQMGGAGGRTASDLARGLGGVYGTAENLDMYANQGPGPSLAQAQLDANTANAMRQQLAIAGSGRGQGGGANAFRTAAANQAQIAGQGNAQTAMLQAQEAQDWRQAQLQAYGMAGDLYGQGGGIALQQAGQNDAYALGLGGLANDAMNQSGQLALGGENLSNQIFGTALSGTQGYEQNMTDIWGIDKGIGKQVDPNEMGTKDWVSLGADTFGTLYSGS
jgi:hypothetical protein